MVESKPCGVPTDPVTYRLSRPDVEHVSTSIGVRTLLALDNGMQFISTQIWVRVGRVLRQAHGCRQNSAHVVAQVLEAQAGRICTDPQANLCGGPGQERIARALVTTAPT